MHPAAPFVLPAWKAAFESLQDRSPTLVAGTAMWARPTHVVYGKKLLRREPKAERVVEEPATNAYYLVTDAGLHIGHDPTEHVQLAGLEPGARFDYFVPRERIVSVSRWEVGEGGVMAKVNVGEEGACVDIRFEDHARQFSGNTEGELSAVAQRENLIRAVVDGVAPIIDSATKVCPDCAETVKYLANVCRFCGYRFDGQPRSSSMLKALAARLTDRIAEPSRFLAPADAASRAAAGVEVPEPEARNGHRV